MSHKTPHIYTLKSYVVLAVLTAILCVLVSASGGLGMTTAAINPSEGTSERTSEGTFEGTMLLEDLGFDVSSTARLSRSHRSYAQLVY